MKYSGIAELLIIPAFIISCSNGYIRTDSALQFTILKKGKGEKTQIGDKVLLYETTSYRNGTVLYSNEGSESPIKVEIGAGQVTAAVDQGLLGMREGEIKQLIAPPNLVQRTIYPENTSPDSTLVIKILLYKILTKERE